MIHDRFGSVPLRSFPHFDLIDFARFWIFERRQRVDILNLLPYRREKAMRVIETDLGWEYYGRQAYESVYTRFLQGSILPRKFGFDKRRTHLATLINFGQMGPTRPWQLWKSRSVRRSSSGETSEFVIEGLALPKVSSRVSWRFRRGVLWISHRLSRVGGLDSRGGASACRAG